MSEIAVNLFLAGVPVNALASVPTVTIQRLDTGAEVIVDSAMTDRTTRGLYSFNFTTVVGLRYAFLIDADPGVSGQVDTRYHNGALDGDDLQMLELLEADHVYDFGGGLVHAYRRGTTVDLIPAKTVVGTQQTNNASLAQ